MFTGIVTAIGTLSALHSRGRDSRLEIESGDLDLSDVALGDSIAVSGVCLTAVALTSTGFAADVSAESLERTLFSSLPPGSKVNLEKSLTPSTRMGGHLVTGHVDGVGVIKEAAADGRSQRIVVEVPPALARYVAEKGSICIDGTSLTVNSISGVDFAVNIVPHTLEHTIAETYRRNTRVHLEVDIIARYLERLVLGEHASDPAYCGVTLETLRLAGFS
jgi:riboflavin synthase